MKKTSNIMLSTLVIGGLITPIFTSAAEVNTLESNGEITFRAPTPEEEDSGTKPLDPGTEKPDPENPEKPDPENPIEPVDPTTPDEKPKPGTPGPLSIDFASSFQFNKNKISSNDMTYWAQAQKIKVENEGSEKYVPNFVQVTDNRGTEEGWSLDVKQNGQFKNESGKELKGAVLKLRNGHTKITTDSKKPNGNDDIKLNPDGELSNAMNAPEGHGAGTSLLIWGDGENMHESIGLEVPGSTVKYASTYTTTLTWSLKNVPTKTE